MYTMLQVLLKLPFVDIIIKYPQSTKFVTEVMITATDDSKLSDGTSHCMLNNKVRVTCQTDKYPRCC